MKAINLSWAGKEYNIPANKAFQIGETIEDIATMSEILNWSKEPKFRKIARCYGEMLRFAGCKVSDAEILTDMMDQIKATTDQAAAENIIAAQAVGALVALLMDGAPEAKEDDDGKKAAAS